MKNKYRINGSVCYVDLGNGLETVIDTDDLCHIEACPGRWTAYFEQCTKSYYCKTSFKTASGKWTTKRLSRVIMQLNCSDVVVDHIDHNTLDNRKNNLRVVTREINQQNQIKKHVDNTSGHIGAYKKRDKYIAQVFVMGKPLYLGTFATAEEASKTYQKWKETNGLVKQGAYTAACF